MPVDFPDDKPAARGCAIQNWALLIAVTLEAVVWRSILQLNLELGDYWTYL